MKTNVFMTTYINTFVVFIYVDIRKNINKMYYDYVF